ncbi:MAG TPA: GNAT family N-acetyltransferase [Anaerolineae bacterium]|jgi:ribosomal protein S18 acetylase RimI-like enzyme
MNTLSPIHISREIQLPPANQVVETATLDDRAGIYDMLLHSGIFNRTDAECVDQMFNEAFTRPSDDNYQFIACREGDRLTGFACYGREALTHGTWDLFWICVSGESRRKGAGRALLAEVQQRAAHEQVRLIVIYTSSTDKYAPARRLYESLGFARTAIVPDYYSENDDLYIYTQRLARKE